MRLNLMGATELTKIGRFPFGWALSFTQSQLVLLFPSVSSPFISRIYFSFRAQARIWY